MGEFLSQSSRVDGSTGGSLQPFTYYHLHSIVTPRREMKVVSSFPTRVIIIQLYVLYFKLQIRGRERLQPSATSRK